jgi:hypothetical protein
MVYISRVGRAPRPADRCIRLSAPPAGGRRRATGSSPPWIASTFFLPFDRPKPSSRGNPQQRGARQRCSSPGAPFGPRPRGPRASGPPCRCLRPAGGAPLPAGRVRGRDTPPEARDPRPLDRRGRSWCVRPPRRSPMGRPPPTCSILRNSATSSGAGAPWAACPACICLKTAWEDDGDGEGVASRELGSAAQQRRRGRTAASGGGRQRQHARRAARRRGGRLRRGRRRRGSGRPPPGRGLRAPAAAASLIGALRTPAQIRYCARWNMRASVAKPVLHV